MHDTSKWFAVGTRADHVTIRTAGAWVRVVERSGHWRRVDIRKAPVWPEPDPAVRLRTDQEADRPPYATPKGGPLPDPKKKNYDN